MENYTFGLGSANKSGGNKTKEKDVSGGFGGN
jgi:hypothetical protein